MCASNVLSDVLILLLNNLLCNPVVCDMFSIVCVVCSKVLGDTSICTVYTHIAYSVNNGVNLTVSTLVHRQAIRVV